MPKSDRTLGQRLDIELKARLEPDSEMIAKVYLLVQEYAAMHGNGSVVTQPFLLEAIASDVCCHLAAYSGVKAADNLGDSKRSIESVLEYREAKTAELARLTRKMLEVIEHPACGRLLLGADDEQCLNELLHKALARYRPDAIEDGKEWRKAKRKECGIKDESFNLRRGLIHAIADAWIKSTGKAVPGRSTNADQTMRVGIFSAFLDRVLGLTSQTRSINRDDAYREAIIQSKIILKSLGVGKKGK
jgi:hypothetical protein